LGLAEAGGGGEYMELLLVRPVLVLSEVVVPVPIEEDAEDGRMS